MQLVLQHGDTRAGVSKTCRSADLSQRAALMHPQTLHQRTLVVLHLVYFVPSG